MEYKTLKTKAVILNERKFAEVDKFFILFTAKFGKIEVLAKGIQKIKAKLRGGLQILNHISLEFVKGKNFYIVTDTKPIEEFLNLKYSQKKYRAALYILNLLDRLVKGEEKDEKIWNLLLETLKNLQLTTYNLSLTLRYFEWNFISYLGFKPELYFCVVCQREIKGKDLGKLFFSAREGGVLCRNCKGKLNKIEIKDISKDAIKILRLIIKKDKKTLKRLKITPFLEKELKEISNYFLQYLLEERMFIV